MNSEKSKLVSEMDLMKVPSRANSYNKENQAIIMTGKQQYVSRQVHGRFAQLAASEVKQSPTNLDKGENTNQIQIDRFSNRIIENILCDNHESE